MCKTKVDQVIDEKSDRPAIFYFAGKLKIAFNITVNLPNKRIIILVHYEYVHFCYILVYVTQCVHDTILMDFSK